MKTSFLLIIVCMLIAAYSLAQVPPKSGWLKVSIENVKCINKSYDGIVELDGHGNEISVTYSYRIYKASNPGAAKKGTDGTVIYGSNVNGMTRAGTQTPDLGGIKNGDVVNIFKPMINEHIDADDIIVIAPNVWEWDEPQKNTITAFNLKLDEDLDWVLKKPVLFSDVPVKYNYLSNPLEKRIIRISDIKEYGPAIKYQNVFTNVCSGTGNVQGNRVINLYCLRYNDKPVIAFHPNLLILDTRALNGLAINNANSVISGTSHAQKESQTTRVDGVTIMFEENSYNKTDNNGIYSVFLRIEFTPDRETSIQNSGLSGEPTRIINKTTTRIPATTLNNLTVIGNWYGIKTNDNGLYPENFGFELNANNQILFKNINGNIGATGTYSFTNNTITGSYKQQSDGQIFSFTGTYDAATQKLSGTLGLGTSVTGQGKWTLSKK